MKLVIIVTISMMFYAIAEYCSKLYANTVNLRYAAYALVAYNILSIAWFISLRMKNNLTILATMWNMLYLIISIFIGLVLFKEQITTTNWIGIGLALLAIVFLYK